MPASMRKPFMWKSCASIRDIHKNTYNMTIFLAQQLSEMLATIRQASLNKTTHDRVLHAATVLPSWALGLRLHRRRSSALTKWKERSLLWVVNIIVLLGKYVSSFPIVGFYCKDKTDIFLHNTACAGRWVSRLKLKCLNFYCSLYFLFYCYRGTDIR